jgi:hypothetical protein
MDPKMPTMPTPKKTKTTTKTTPAVTTTGPTRSAGTTDWDDDERSLARPAPGSPSGAGLSPWGAGLSPRGFGLSERGFGLSERASARAWDGDEEEYQAAYWVVGRSAGSDSSEPEGEESSGYWTSDGDDDSGPDDF